MTFGPMPTSDQVRAYLSARGWRFGWAIGSVGWMYVYRDASDDGQPITVFVAAHQTAEDYTQRVFDVIETLQAFDRRPRRDIIADLLAVEVPSAPPTPASVA